MDKYLSMVMDYINRSNTNYALLISGDWGNGKTYFIDNIVFPELQREEKKPIYVSLNGINSIEEISKQIYFETSFLSDERFKKVRDSKTVKNFSQFLKVVHNGASMLNWVGSADQKIDFEEIIDLKENFVLFFDDLERCRIDIVELLGYFNGFVEHDEIKVVLVGNEKEIKDIKMEQNRELKMLAARMSLKESEDFDEKNILDKVDSLFFEHKTYDVIKEKVIGKTIIFKSDTKFVVSEVVEEFKVDDVAYYEFLIESIDHILYIFEKSERRNIRILKHSLNDFQMIYNILNETQTPLLDDELLIKIFIPALIFGIEYRSGKMTEKDYDKLSTSKLTESNFIFMNSEESIIYSKYLKGYTKINEYFTVEQILDYITSSLIINKDLLNEVDYIINTWIIGQDYILVKNSLLEVTENFLDLENEEFDKYTIEVLAKVQEGYYPLQYYPKIFLRFEFFVDNYLIYNSKEELVEVFIEGIGKSKKELQETDRFPMFYIENKSQNQILIENEITKRIKRLKAKTLEENLTELINLLPEDIDEFINQYREMAKGSNGHNAIMQFFDINDYFEKIKMLKNKDIIDIRSLYQTIYSFSNISDYYREDHIPMEQLINLLTEHLDEVRGIRRLSLELLIQELQEKYTELSKS